MGIIKKSALIEGFILAIEVKEDRGELVIIKKPMYLNKYTLELNRLIVFDDMFLPTENATLEELNKKIISNNNLEYKRLINRMEEVKQYPYAENCKKILSYLDEVKFRFEEWFRNNGHLIPSDICKDVNLDVCEKIKKKNLKQGNRKNYPLLYRKYLEANIRLFGKNKKLPKQKELSKTMDCSEATISRMLNEKNHLTAISLLIMNINSGKEQLLNYKILDDDDKDSLSELAEYLARTKANMIQQNFKRR